jgi:hypothetical protein
MRRMLMVLVTGMTLGISTLALAADPPPDCTEKQKAVDDAKDAAKAAAKPDLSSCKDMKGKEKSECEKPIKAKSKDDSKAAKDKVKDANTALACCKNPKKKGCTP